MDNLKEQTQEYLASLTRLISEINLDDLHQIENLFRQAIKNKNTIFTCGNGGSAATASHYVCDWTKMFYEQHGKQLKAFCLCDNVNFLTAYANDICFEQIFAKGLMAYGSHSDILISVSGSGNSQNVVNALHTAKDLGIKTISIVGYDGGAVKKLTDLCIHVPSFDMQLCEDLHLSFGHWIMKWLMTMDLKDT